MSIIKGDETTSNFSASENLVVLECIDRLLKIGYTPENIELEKKWTLGKKDKGKLDILVKKNGISFLMIECKTWGSEYNKEVKKTQTTPNKSQLFSYYQQDQKANYICLYTSHFYNEILEYDSSIIETKDYANLSNIEEIAQRWNRQFKNSGIFEKEIKPYNYEPKSITTLKDIQPDDSGIIFNQFAEILRHHVVSDKSNAFNKIFNLFLCKLVDEEFHKQSEEYKFQVKESDTDEDLLLRLNDLYKQGMKEFLDKDVTDFSTDEYKNWDDETKKVFNKMRLHKNNEFAFVEVYDEESFYENAKIVREVVELLQSYRLKYASKHQFLGDFFELLLNTGLKQESGQFFTPIPIARFMILSLRMENIISDKINNNENNFLPYIIDFAMGSGHFLTESMDVIDKIIKKYPIENINPYINRELEKYKQYQFDWANEYIYGIEKDYRLVKTAKISCFLHGDGLANILHGDGIAPYNSKHYRGRLQFKSPKVNHNFDVLIANPPYAVQAFKSIMSDGEKNFDLYNSLTDNSSEIEVLFIERMNHLLKEGGVASIILPSSILTGERIQDKARKIIIENFEILGITELDSKTFMATGKDTVILFLRKRKHSIIEQAKKEIQQYLSKQVITEGIQSYLDTMGLIEENDFEKLFTYILTYKTITIISTMGNNAEKFRGYSFSSRRGKEGIDFNPNSTSLYDENDWENPNKLATLYRKHISNEEVYISDSIKENAFICATNSLFNWDNSINWRTIRLSKKKNITSKYPIVKLDKITNAINTKESPKIEVDNYLEEGKYPIISQDSSKIISGYTNDNNPIIDIPLVLFGDHTCIVKYIDFPFFRGADGTKLLKCNKKMLPKFLYYLLKFIYIPKKGQYERHFKYIKESDMFPMPSIKIQQKIINRMDKHENILKEFIDVSEKSTSKTVNDAKNQQKHIMSEVFTIEEV